MAAIHTTNTSMTHGIIFQTKVDGLKRLNLFMLSTRKNALMTLKLKGEKDSLQDGMDVGISNGFILQLGQIIVEFLLKN